jgi:hypothetical protein
MATNAFVPEMALARPKAKGKGDIANTCSEDQICKPHNQPFETIISVLLAGRWIRY